MNENIINFYEDIHKYIYNLIQKNKDLHIAEIHVYPEETIIIEHVIEFPDNSLFTVSNHFDNRILDKELANNG